ncbi:MAG: Hsp70 family protein [Austwickia sp.]|nr:Hsp70 family protein [Actinomycetota bacterium]MCB1254180.1 Hsp70 family protein [Austwickia sp.]MCO5308528.1 Hsp70 family protein [Austwickia sp.]
MTSPAPVIGIDLGTTYSAVAHVDSDSQVRVIPNAEGRLLTASAVYFDPDGSVVVGDAAKVRDATDPDRTVIGIKRWMGKDHVRWIDDQEYRPEAISAVILRSLVVSAAADLGCSPDAFSAVITVPAYFGVAEREATAAAARIAGIRCLDLVAEPVAAALSFGVRTGVQGSVLVYDLGGGTFDATVVALGPSGPVVASVDGSTELGGLNFDERLVGLVSVSFAHVSGADVVDDEAVESAVWSGVEDLKRSLSRADRAVLTVDVPGQRTRVSVTREQFEKECADLLALSLDITDRAIAAAGRGVPRPAVAVLVGGSTRMPMVAEALGRRFGLPVRVDEPDLAVAKGAAIHAAALADVLPRLGPGPSASGAPPTAALRLAGAKAVATVLPRALGIKLHDSADPSGERVLVHHIIGANTPLPVEGATFTCATVLNDQDRIRIELMEQAGAVASPELVHHRRVLDGEITGVPAGLRAGSPIEITLEVSLAGQITCIATEPRSGKRLELTSYMDGVADGTEEAAQRSRVNRLVLREN